MKPTFPFLEHLPMSNSLFVTSIFFGIYGGFKLGVDKTFQILCFFACPTKLLERHSKRVTHL